MSSKTIITNVACVNSGMDYWNGGIVEWWKGKFLKVYFQILHPNKAHIHVSQHIITLNMLDEVSINLSNDGNTKKTLDLTLIYNHIVANSENKLNGGL